MTIGFPVTVYPSKSIVTNGVDYLHGVASGAEVRISASNLFQAGNQTAVAGSKMKIEKLLENSGVTWKLEDEGAIWAGKTFTYAGISNTFTSAYDGGAGPVTGLFVFTNNDGATGDVVAGLFDAVARQNGGTVFAMNPIARNHTGVTAKLVGMEIDFQPFGTTPSSGSGALYINCFNVASPGCFIQTGSLGGGAMANGISLHGVASTGSGLSAQTGTTMGSLINTGLATFSQDAVILQNTHKIRLSGTSTTHGKFYMDSSNNERLVLGTGLFAIRDSSDTTSLFTFLSSGVAQAAAWDATTEHRTNGTKVLGARDTGYVAMTGTSNKNTVYDTSTVTLAQLAGRVMALQASLTTHGAIGT
jgi:hypothetical protein